MSKPVERKPNVAGNRNQRIRHELPGHAAEANAMPRMGKSSIIVFCARFDNNQRMECYHFMYILKLIYLTTIQLVKQVWSFPQSVTNAVQQRRQLAVRNELEAERLDRIRNPLKYLGK
jgi:hypothetical protein